MDKTYDFEDKQSAGNAFHEVSLQNMFNGGDFSFGDLNLSGFQGPSAYDQDAIRRNAKFTALTKAADSEDPLGEYEKIFQMMEQQSALYDRHEQERKARMDRIRRGASEMAMIQSGNPELTNQLRDASATMLAEEQANKYPLEKDAAEALNKLWGTDDPELIDKWQQQHALGGTEAQIEFNRRQLAIMSEIERVQAPIEERGMFWNVINGIMDIAPYFVLPIKDATSRVDNVPIEGHSPSIFDNFIAGGRQKRENAVLMGMTMSPEEFDKLLPEVMDEWKRQSRDAIWLGKLNRGQYLMRLHEALENPNSSTIDLLNAVDATVVGGIVFNTGRRVGRISSALRMNGAIKESSEYLAKAINVAEEEGMNAATRKLGATFDELIDEVPASALNESGEQGIGVGIEAASRAERGRELLESLWKMRGGSPLDVRRLNPAEQEKAFEEVQRIWQKRLGRKIEDIKIVNPTKGSGIDSPTMQLFLGGVDGPFKTLAGARRFAKSIGIGEAGVELRVPGEYIGDAVKVPYRLRGAAADETILSVREGIEGGYATNKFTVDPTPNDWEAAVNLHAKTKKDPKVLITRDGNPILSLDPNQTWDDFIRQTGVNREDVGRLWYNPEKVGKDGYYNPGKPIESARRAIDPETNKLGFTLFDKMSKGTIEGGIEKNVGDPYYYVRVDAPVNEQGFFDPITDVKSLWGFSRFVLGGAQLSSKDVFGLSVLGIARRNALVTMLNKQVSPVFQALSKAERKHLNTIVKLGDKEAKWFNDTEVTSMYHREFPEANAKNFLKAYKTMVAVNDIEYFLRNSELYSIKNALGFQTIKFNNVRFNKGVDEVNGRVYHDPSEARPEGRIYDATDDTHFTRTDIDQKPYSPAEQKRLGKMLIELDEPIEVIGPGGNVIKVPNVLVDKAEVTVKRLRTDQINYRKGGHRIYGPRVKFFAKQAQIHTQPDTQERLLLNPRTFIGGESKVDVQRWVQKMEDARDIYARYKNGELKRRGMQNLLSQKLGKEQAQKFILDMDEGKMHYDVPFEVVYDRGLPSEYAKGRFNTSNVDEMPGTFSHANTSGRLYYSPKSKEVLTDPFGEELPTMDVFETLDKSLMNVANITGLGPYKTRAMEKWVSTYGHILDVDPKAPLGRKFQAPFKTGQDPVLEKAAEQQRMVVRRVLNWMTPEDRMFQEHQRTFMEYFDEKMANTGWINDATRRNINKAINYTVHSRPADFLRGIAFDMKLGLFNIGQFPMQISTMLAATSISPIHGMEGMNLTFFSRVMGPERFRAYFERVGTRQFGYETADDLIEMLDAMHNSGWLEVGKTHSLINDYGSAVYNLTGNKVQDFREAGRFFFYEAERWNRTIAFHIAWKDVMKANPALKTGSQAFMEKVMARSETLSMNMTEASSAAWQKGLASIPTQFWAYQIRMMENIVEGFVKGGKGNSLTRMEAFRLMTGQYIAYGTAGLPFFGGFIQDTINDTRGEAANYDKSVLDFFSERGALDTLIYAMTDGSVDVAYSRRAGTGFFVSDIMKELVNQGHYGETSTAEFLTGASGSIWLTMSGDFIDVYRAGLAEKGVGPVTADEAADVFRNVSIVNNSLKAYMAWKSGIVTSKSGTPLYETDSGAEALSLFMGIPLGEDIDITARMEWMKNRKENKEEVVKVLRNYRSELINNYDDREKVMRKINAFSAMIPPELLQEALVEMQAYPADPFYDSLYQQVEKKKAKDELAKKLRQDTIESEKQ